MKKILTNNILRILALFIVFVLYGLAVPSRISDAEKKQFIKEFKFKSIPLYQPEEIANKVRAVHSQYEKISAWISAVGAAVTVADTDNDRKYNDLIHVDPRYDKVIVSPAPQTGSRYLPYTIEPQILPYDKETTAPMGVLTNDFNGDGLSDILVYYWGRTPIIFLKNKAGYTELELSKNVERWFTNAATLADFDGDGNTDILITNYFPDGSRVLDKKAMDSGQTMQHSMSRAFNGGTNHFFLFKDIVNNQPVFVEDKNWEKGIRNPKDWTLAVGSVDFNGDLLPEVYLANDFGPDKLLLNQSSPGQLKFKELHGERGLTTIASSVLGKDSFKGMGVGLGDMNNDGLMDIYVSNIADEYALHESHFAFINTGETEKYSQGIAPFIDEGEQLGVSRSSWGWDSKLGDFNNDGTLEAIQATGFLKGKIDRWPELQELALGNDELLALPGMWPKFQPGDDLSGHDHNPFFVKSNSGKFYDLASEIGIGKGQVTRGIATGDMDYDGDLDFAVANQWERSYYYQNNYSGDKKSLGLQIFFPIDTLLEDVLINPKNTPKTRPAIGTIVKLYHGEQLAQINFVDGGNGHSGVNSKDVFFGLDKQTDDVKIEIHYLNKLGEPLQKQLSLTSGWHTIVLPF